MLARPVLWHLGIMYSHAVFWKTKLSPSNSKSGKPSTKFGNKSYMQQPVLSWFFLWQTAAINFNWHVTPWCMEQIWQSTSRWHVTFPMYHYCSLVDSCTSNTFSSVKKTCLVAFMIRETGTIQLNMTFKGKVNNSALSQLSHSWSSVLVRV